MRFTFFLLAIVSISSSLASAHYCFPRSSPFAVPITALGGFSHPPVQKPTSPPPKPQTPTVTTPKSPPVTKPQPAPADKPKKPLAPPAAGGALDASFAAVIKSLCAKTSEPDLCLNSIKPVVGTIKVSNDATGVLKLAMQALRVQTDAAINTAKKYVADPKTEKLAMQALNDCLDSYDDAKYSLDHVDAALQANDKGTVNSLLSTVGTDYDTCENGFDDFEIESLMGDFDTKLMKLNSICLAIAKAANLMA